MNDSGSLERRGLVHLYCGDGKGKTTAAVGLCVRALGAGETVLFCQFLKGRATAELAPLEQLGVTVLRAKCGEKFLWNMTDGERQELFCSHAECLEQARGLAESGRFGLVVLDEAVDAVNCGALALERLLGLIESRPPGVELVLTGRNPAPELVAVSDYYTEFSCLRHPFQRGIAARRGVEY